MEDRNNASVYYSMNMLRLLLEMKLITDDEYEKIMNVVTEHYDSELYLV